MKVNRMLVLVAWVSACSDNHKFMPLPGFDAVIYADAHVDAHPDAPPDASPDAAIARTCHNGTKALSGNAGSQIETLILDFGCGTHAAGIATYFLVSTSTPQPPPFNFICVNNTLTFPSETLTTVKEIVGQEFDIFCD